MSAAGLRHRLGVATDRALRVLVRLLPLGTARWAGRRLGGFGYVLDRRHRRRALDRLAEAFPDLDAGGRRRLARRSCGHLGATAADTLAGGGLDLVELCRRLTLEGWEHLQAAEAGGRGVIVLTSHLGSWEIATWAVAVYAGPVHALGRRFANPLRAAEAAHTAEAFSLRPLPERGAAQGMVAALAAGEKVAVVLDRPPPPGAERIELPFCGRPLAVSPVPARLALEHACPAVPVFALPAAGGRFRLVVRPPIPPPDLAVTPSVGTPPGPGPVADLTARYLVAVAAEVGRRPELWPWGALG